MLGLRVVDGDDRNLERAIFGHRAQPDYAGGRFLHARLDVVGLVGELGVQQADEVGAVVHRDRRTAFEHGAQMAVVSVAIFAVDGEGGNAVLIDQRRRDVVLGRERIRRAGDHFGAARLERAQQVGGLAGDMQAGAEALALERQFPGEPLAQAAQHGHLLVGPFDSLATGLGESEVMHVEVAARCRWRGIWGLL